MLFVAVLTALATLGAATAQAQGQPGRLLISPRTDVVVACNADGSDCFSVVGGDPTHPVSGAIEPSVAATGTIAFEAIWGPDGTCSVGGQGICWPHVFLMDANGTNVRQLTFNPAGADAAGFGGDKNASISPDGTMVAFVSNRNPALDSSGHPNYLFQVYVVNTDGSGLRQLTFPSYDSSGNPHGNMRTVAWSPDSTKLAYSGNVYTTTCGTYFGSPIDVGLVRTLSLDGGAAPPDYVCLGDNGGAIALDWSPDGTLIAYGRDSGLGEPPIAFIDLSGQGRFAGGLTTSQLGARCTESPHHCFHFSPDSARLAYENQSVNAISIIDPDGTGRSDAVSFGGTRPERGIWWAPGSAIPAAAQLTFAPDPLEVWPGFRRQTVPALNDATGNPIFHAAASYAIEWDYFSPHCTEIGPFGLAMYSSTGNGTGTMSVTNAGFVSNSIRVKCWASSPCTYALSSSGENVSANGGPGSVGVITDPGPNDSICPWNASSNAPWITITSGSDGSGTSSVDFTVAANTGPARQGTMTIAEQTFTVTQDAGTAPPPSADLSITKTGSPNPVTVGSNLTYTITATNNGPSGATGISISDPLPAAMTFVSATPSQGNCSGTTTVDCSIGSLSSGASATVTIIVTPSQTGSFDNTATVAGNEPDPNLANNSATQMTTVNPPPATLSALSPAKLWLGQDGSSKQLKLDLLAEVLVNGNVVGSGQLANLSAGGSDFSQATLETISLVLGSSTNVPAGATFSIRVSVRSSCSVKKSGNSGTARLWYNGQPIDTGKLSSRDAGGRFDATIGVTNTIYFLRPGFTLATTAGTSREFVDVAVSDSAACQARPFAPIGTWTITLP
jgi:uncharacterized repeat protein (TIGR01451 family)